MTLAASQSLLVKVKKSVQAVTAGWAFFFAASASCDRPVARTRPRARAEYLWQAGRALGIADTGRWNRASLTSRHGVSLNTPSKKFFARSEEHTSELQSLMRISYAVFCLKKKKKN